MSLVVYGFPPSQPSRAVYWTCLLKGLPFELRAPDFLRMRSPEFACLNPKQQVPVLVDGDFSLYEMPAILIYLCDKHGWSDLYPRDVEARALVHQYLHFHHSSTRLATFKLMAPHVTIAFGGIGDGGMDLILSESIRIAMQSSNVLEEGRGVVRRIAGMIESSYLSDSPFLCGMHCPSIADIACYEELAQLRWAQLFDFEEFPRVDHWLQAMARLPAHDSVHRYNTALGDILTQPITLERFIEANAVGLAALAELGVPIGEER